MPSDERLHDAVEHLLGELRSPLGAGFRAFADRLGREAAAARDAAIRDADAAAAEARRRADDAIEGVRRSAQSRLEEVERMLGERLVAVQRELDDLRRGVEESRRGLQAGRQEADALRSQLDAARAELDATRGLAETCTAAVLDTRMLLDAVRSLDEAAALGDVLDCLVDVRRGDEARLAVYVIRGVRLQRWRAAGFDATAASVSIPGSAEVALEDGGLMADAVRSGRAAVHAAADGTSPAPGGAEGRLAVAVPVVLGGAVVAVLYADTLPRDAETGRQWPAIYEVLARHASRVLEAIAVRRAAGLLPPGGLVAGPAPGHATGRSLR